MDRFDDIIKNKIIDYRPEPPQTVINSVRSFYPKKKSNIPKELYIASIITIVIVLSYFFIGELTKTQEPLFAESVSEINQIEILFNPKQIISDIQDEKIEIQSEKSLNILPQQKEESNKPVISYSKINYFKAKEIIICGDIYEFDENINTDKIIIPENLKLVINENGNQSIKATKEDAYKIIYYEKEGSRIISDTMFIIFSMLEGIQYNEVALVNCFGDSYCIELNIPNNAKFEWFSDAELLDGNTENQYCFKWYDSGTKNLKLTVENNYCKYEKIIQVIIPEALSFNVNSYDDFCGSSVGYVQIDEPKNLINNIFIYDEAQLPVNINKLRVGEYNLEIYYNQACKHTEKIIISEGISIKAGFISEQRFSDDDKFYFINSSRINNNFYVKYSDVSFVWYINGLEYSNDDNFSYAFSEDGVYNVTLKAIYNNVCEDIYSEIITVSNTKFIAPNIFTPNDDGIDDRFLVKANQPVTKFHGIISNRTGEVVFEWRNIDEYWDGRIRGGSNASEGVYFYILRAEDKSGKIIEKKGIVQLVR